MKKYLLISFLMMITTQLNAGYMSKVDLQDCNKIGRKIRLKKNDCGPSCIKIPKNYNCKTFSEQDTEVNDLEKPKFTKSEIVSCSDEDDCQVEYQKKIDDGCLDSDEGAIKNLDLLEVYCSQPNGYDQKTVKMFREDAIKKATYDGLKASELIKKNNRNTSRGQMRGLISSLKAGTDLTPAQRRKLDLLIIRKLINE